MGIIDRLSEEELEIPVEEIEAEAEKEGMEGVREGLEELVSQGLIVELPGGRVSKVVKRLFW